MSKTVNWIFPCIIVNDLARCSNEYCFLDDDGEEVIEVEVVVWNDSFSTSMGIVVVVVVVAVVEWSLLFPP